MNVLILNGARNPEGQTAAAVAALAEGAQADGAAVEQQFLPGLHLERCRQCNDDGWGICRSQGQCGIEDDFAALADQVASADAVVFATPVYFSDLSESLRAFLDRLRRTCTHPAGRERVEGKPAVGVCVAGGGGGGAPQCTASLSKVLGTCGFECADMVAVRRQNLEAKLPRLRAAGQWLAGLG
ncbi:MAG: flavodoxin family protein [Candidatus Brocadiia bacterium]